eukprot:scaffold3747_cov240-Pinguiococcus_pyrenoidosus.AAC.5
MAVEDVGDAGAQGHVEVSVGARGIAAAQGEATERAADAVSHAEARHGAPGLVGLSALAGAGRAGRLVHIPVGLEVGTGLGHGRLPHVGVLKMILPGQVVLVHLLVDVLDLLGQELAHDGAVLGELPALLLGLDGRDVLSVLLVAVGLLRLRLGLLLVEHHGEELHATVARLLLCAAQVARDGGDDALAVVGPLCAAVAAALVARVKSGSARAALGPPFQPGRAAHLLRRGDPADAR